MRIVDLFNRTEFVSTLEELESRLRERDDQGRNAFWLSHDHGDYPALALLVAGERATLSYFPKEHDAGWQSVGGRSHQGTARFAISEFGGDDVYVPGNAVLPFPNALAAAREFFVSATLPPSVEWLRL